VSDSIAGSETAPVLRARTAFETKPRGAGVVSSAISPLDLGALSMADFGDTEPAH
jgi:hypothetical protein